MAPCFDLSDGGFWGNMADIDYFQILKWVLIVLSAGFIGQFGKSLATYLMKKARASKPANSSPGASTKLPEETKTGTPATSSAQWRESQDKADKKASKALVKLKKKESKQK